MRHNKKINHLSRTSAHRKAMLANMSNSLIMNKRIFTTVAKAKALRKFIEPLITKSKNDTTHSRRVVFGYLQNKEAVSELFREVAKKIENRPGGYTRILKTGNRLGDNAELCMIELVDYNENYYTEKTSSAKKTRRSRRGGKSKKTTNQENLAEQNVVDEKNENTENPIKEQTTTTNEENNEEKRTEDIDNQEEKKNNDN